MISIAAIRPMPPSRGISRCEINALVFSDRVHQQLLAPLFGEEVDDAVQRLVGAVGVQRREAQMTGLGELNAVLHRFLVANLTDQNDIRCLAQRVLQRRVPGFRIHADFALRDDTTLMRVHVLDRILDRNDMAARVFIAMTDHRRERGRLTGTRTANDDTQTALVHHDVFQDRR